MAEGDLSPAGQAFQGQGGPYFVINGGTRVSLNPNQSAFGIGAYEVPAGNSGAASTGDKDRNKASIDPSAFPSIKGEGDLVKKMLARINQENALNGIVEGALTAGNISKSLLGAVKENAIASINKKIEGAMGKLNGAAESLVAQTKIPLSQRGIDTSALMGENDFKQTKRLFQDSSTGGKFFSDMRTMVSETRAREATSTNTFSLSAFKAKITKVSRNQYFILDIPFLHKDGTTSPLTKGKQGEAEALFTAPYLTALARTVTTPSISQGTTVVPYKGQEYKMADKTVFSDVNATFLCEENGILYQNLVEWMGLAYDVETSNWGFPDEYKQEITIIQLHAGDSGQTSATRLYGAYPTNVASLSFDQAGGQFLTFDVTFTFDYAKTMLSIADLERFESSKG
jgi:hypothetical protein